MGTHFDRLPLREICLAVIVYLLLPRFFTVLSADFPLNDGGMFATMVTDVAQAGFRLPLTLSYNHAALPFAYPPLSFYVAAALHTLFGVPVSDILRWLPLAVSCLSVAVFYGFIRTLFPKQSDAALITVAFAALPRSYEWLIMGGGLSRSFGFCFSIAALWMAMGLLQTAQRRYTVAAAVASAATVLSHPESSIFLAYSLPLLVLFRRHWLQDTRRLLPVIAGTALVTAPWWMTVLSRHGITPFLSAFSTGDWLSYSVTEMLSFNVIEAYPANLFLILAIAGMGLAVLQRRFFPLAWYVLAFLFTGRSAKTAVTLPLAISAGLVLIEWMSYARKNRPQWTSAVLAVLLVLSTVIVNIVQVLSGQSSLEVLSRENRTAMAWVREQTPEDAAFLVVTNVPWWMWYRNRVAEWFPALSRRRSITTVQGYEWLPEGYAQRRMLNLRLRNCADKGIDCYEQWEQDTGERFTHVYVDSSVRSAAENPCCSWLIASLSVSPQYKLLYEDGTIHVWAKLPRTEPEE